MFEWLRSIFGEETKIQRRKQQRRLRGPRTPLNNNRRVWAAGDDEFDDSGNFTTSALIGAAIVSDMITDDSGSSCGSGSSYDSGSSCGSGSSYDSGSSGSWGE